jgi:hypothetical protein
MAIMDLYAPSAFPANKEEDESFDVSSIRAERSCSSIKVDDVPSALPDNKEENESSEMSSVHGIEVVDAPNPEPIQVPTQDEFIPSRLSRIMEEDESSDTLSVYSDISSRSLVAVGEDDMSGDDEDTGVGLFTRFDSSLLALETQLRDMFHWE